MTWKPDYTALIVSYAYVFSVIGVAELLRRLGKRPQEFTRKFIHIGVGMWVVGTVFLFETWYLALIPPISFIVINALSYWRGTFQAMEGGDRGNLGTVYFPLSFAVLIYCFWSQPVLMVASLMPLTWGDAMAGLVGQRYGHYRYTIAGRSRSVEGSVAMLFWSWITTSLALFIMPYLLGKPLINWLLALIYGGAIAVVCTLVEALTPWGLDNLTIPAATWLLLDLLRN
ncbi:MAG: phosphatidate cytidylyltransferase [Anaerolineae bacterium]|jgi:dolichol kinase